MKYSKNIFNARILETKRRLYFNPVKIFNKSPRYRSRRLGKKELCFSFKGDISDSSICSPVIISGSFSVRQILANYAALLLC